MTFPCWKKVLEETFAKGAKGVIKQILSDVCIISKNNTNEIILINSDLQKIILEAIQDPGKKYC